MGNPIHKPKGPQEGLRAFMPPVSTSSCHVLALILRTFQWLHLGLLGRLIKVADFHCPGPPKTAVWRLAASLPAKLV